MALAGRVCCITAVRGRHPMIAYCPKCATKILAVDARFCNSCGAKLPPEDSGESQTAAPSAKPKRKRMSAIVLGVLVVLFIGTAAAPIIFASQGLLPNDR